jgi:hypothetical protein
MSYYVVPHILDDAAFLDRVTHSFLIRDPKASILSYAKLDPDMLLDEIGLEAQWRHADAVMKRTGKPPVVVGSEAVQSDPQGELRKYWQALGLADRPHAVEWNDPPPADWQQVQGWHSEVIASKTIRPLEPDQRSRTEADFKKLTEKNPRYGAYMKHHLPFYNELRRYTV